MQRSMFREIDGNLRACGTTLIASDLLFKAIALLLLTPLVSLLFRLFVVASGRTVLADADIARFLLHPLGWLAFVLVGGAVVCIFALEQAVLMTVCIWGKTTNAISARKRSAIRSSQFCPASSTSSSPRRVKFHFRRYLNRELAGCPGILRDDECSSPVPFVY